METKELKVQAPEGYEIDKENSTFERIKFKPIKKDITYRDVCKNLFNRDIAYYIDVHGEIKHGCMCNSICDKNNTTTRTQLERLLALNQLLNIATYYNSRVKESDGLYMISYIKFYDLYCVSTSTPYATGITALFNREEDAQAVIDNPNFRKILDTIYKD